MNEKKAFDGTEYCRGLVQQNDPDRYLISLFAPPAARSGIWALLAFNQDIARVRDTVRDPTLGLMRLQWWRDALQDTKSYKGHPVAEALHGAVTQYAIPVDGLHQLIDAREIDVAGPWPDNIDGIENYADFTSTPLCILIARMCGVDIAPEQARYLGVAYALTGLLRAMPHEQDRFKNGPAAHDIVMTARAHLDRAIDIGPAKALRAMRVLTDLYLRRIERVGDVFAPTLQKPLALKELRVWARVTFTS